VRLSAFPEDVLWNSKKWRVLLYLSSDKNMIIAGRQYPFETSVGIDFVLKSALPSSNLIQWENNRFAWTNWNNTLIDRIELPDININFNSPYIPVGNNLVPLDRLVKDAEGSTHYNDVLYSSCYKPIYSFKYLKSFWDEKSAHMPLTNEENTRFEIGGYVYCLRCGDDQCLQGADTMMCGSCELEYGNSDCDLFTYCSNCGRRIFADDAYYVGDEDICPECKDKYTYTCDICGDICWNEDIHFYEPTNQYICNNCKYELNEKLEQE
jgi:hypothetical protein